MFRNKTAIANSSIVFLTLVVLLVPVAHADFTFGEPVNIQSEFPFLDPATDFIFCFSPDELEVYLYSPRAGGQGEGDTWVSKRASIQDPWGAPENLGPLVNGPSDDVYPVLSADGLELYFTSNRPGGNGDYDLYVTKRATRTSPWEAATSLGPKVNSAYSDFVASPTPDGLELYILSDRPVLYDPFDFYVCKRATKNDPWGDPVNVGPAVNSPGGELAASFSLDGLLMFFGSDRPGGTVGAWSDGYMTRRASLSAPWQPAVNLGPIINKAPFFNWSFISPDGSALYILYEFDDSGANYTYKATILPIVDFNADDKVDLADLTALIDNWGTDNALYDIGPYAWGDGKVDIQDLKAFVAQWEKENLSAQP